MALRARQRYADEVDVTSEEQRFLEQAEQARQRAEQVRTLTAKLRDLETDITRFETRRERLLALGDGHVEIPQSTYDEHLGPIDWQPIRSLLSGRELAAKTQENLEHLAGEQKRLQGELDTLLEG